MLTLRLLLPVAVLAVFLGGATTTTGQAAHEPSDLATRAAEPSPPAPAPAEVDDPTTAVLDVELGESAFGRSGALQVQVARPGDAVGVPLEWPGQPPASLAYRWLPVMGTRGGPVSGPLAGPGSFTAPTRPGVYELELNSGKAARQFGERLRLVVTVPFEDKEDGYIGRYFLGHWPTEGERRTDRYAPPAGFIEVTRENQSLRLSEHFSVREFLTHDQKGVWPKYVVVDPRILDKLELVLLDLEEQGVRADHMVIMSGFRTPQYNRKGLGRGRASLSRHQFGDAADVWVDSDGDWYMDDLNGDGRRDTKDARVMLEAVNRVEARHPELVGGAGTYPDNGAHGPFIHIDARGTRARW